MGANLEEVLHPGEYSNYRNVRAVALLFIVLGVLCIIAGIALATENPQDPKEEPSPVIGILVALLGVAGVVGGIAVRRGNKEWSWAAQVMAFGYIWAFPIGTILSLVLLGGIRQYFKSVEKLRRAESGGEESDEQPEMPVKPRARRTVASLECPCCGEQSVERRPENQLAPHPGYRCQNCGILMRPFGMAWVYLIVLAIGLGLAAFFLFLLVNGNAGPEKFVIPFLAAAGALYAIRNLMRPIPRRVPKRDED